MCGIAMVRLRKPTEHYIEKYGTGRYGLNKLYLMMEKQHNRGQEGAGIACIKQNVEPGNDYVFREKAEGKDAVTKIFDVANRSGEDYIGQIYMGHLRYSTTGKSGLAYVHPFLRRSSWKDKTLCLCGNFNMTNVDEVFRHVVDMGMSPRIYSDTYTLLELLSYHLDNETGINKVLSKTMSRFDGGYVICGATGGVEMFVMRDPNGIRPAFYYIDDEVVAVASERPVLQTTFNLDLEDVRELLPGQALIVDADGEMHLQQILQPAEYLPCSFERIYFSRGNDADIYRERKALGRNLVPDIVRALDGDVANTVFSYIPNTAETAYLGMIEALHEQYPVVRSEKVVSKDIKLRTFITEDSSRNDLAAHVYDIAYNSLRPYVDNLVVIDDSIVRGTTLRESIIRILDRLHPKKLVIVSSAPQIRYPDFYGIDMPRMKDFIAYQATVALRRERQMDDVPPSQVYDGLSVADINRKMVELLRPEGVTTPIEIVFQSIEGLHNAIPNHPGDWYFTGHYPTKGGYKLLG
ncbi:MAG: amidophosphoribosyltransferase [Bacteroidales bacterium]|nr:amidophosphoribosyltransferase [Candidatus Liminaster caballi]